MSGKDGAIYHARNAITAKLLRSDTGFFMLDFLGKGDGVCKRVAGNRRWTCDLIGALERVGWVEVRSRLDGEGRQRGLTDVWVFHRVKHGDNELPEGVATESDIESFISDKGALAGEKERRVEEERRARLEAQAEEARRKEGARRAADERAKMGKHCCTRCHEWKVKADFATSARTKTGLRGWCMKCDSDFETAKEKAKEATIKIKQGDEMTAKKLTTENSTAKSLREQAEMLLKQAEEVERVSSNELVMAEVRRVQLEIARSTAILGRVFGEAVDAMDMMEKASEELRKICQKK